MCFLQCVFLCLFLQGQIALKTKVLRSKNSVVAWGGSYHSRLFCWMYILLIQLVVGLLFQALPHTPSLQVLVSGLGSRHASKNEENTC